MNEQKDTNSEENKQIKYLRSIRDTLVAYVNTDELKNASKGFSPKVDVDKFLATFDTLIQGDTDDDVLIRSTVISGFVGSGKNDFSNAEDKMPFNKDFYALMYELRSNQGLKAKTTNPWDLYYKKINQG